MSTYDVIVVGAGFAGLTAARECSNRGLSTLVLEGSDRIGGRTFTKKWNSGESMDVGGTFVHWTQPHVWSEISRYGLTDQVVPSGEEIDEVQVPVPGGVRVMPYSEWAPIDGRLGELLFEASREVFPRPYDPMLMKDEVEKWDISIEDRIQQLDLSEEEQGFLRALYGVDGGGDVSEVSLLSVMRWYALGGHSLDGLAEANFGSRLKGGTLQLLTAIKDDIRADVRLEMPVASVESTDTGVTLTADNGEVSQHPPV